MSQAVTEVKTETPEATELVAEPERASSMSLILNTESMKSATGLAELMASSTVTVPKHLQGQPGDCLAIVLQSMNWGMNPFVVAQKTHLVNGTLGYESQLVNAVVQSQGFIVGTFTYEYAGDGAKMQCRVGAVLRGDSKITYGEWLELSSVTTKNSPLWKTNPKQQLGYLQVKNWARAYTPGAILGVYTPDELESSAPRNITPVEPSNEPVYLTDAEFEANAEKWNRTFLSGHKNGKTIEDFIAWAEQKGKLLSDEHKAIVKQWEPIEHEPPPQEAAPDTSVGDDYFAEADRKEAENAKQ